MPNGQVGVNIRMPAMNRRQFLRAASGTAAAAMVGASGLVSANEQYTAEKDRKLIVVLFGGGTRCSETIDDDRHRYIPHLWNEMMPKGVLFENMRVEHKVVHPNCAGSIMTGHWEWDDIDWSRPVSQPTIFEIYRKARKAPDTAAWAFVYASILAGTGESLAHGYGKNYAANVIEPPTISRAVAEQIDRKMQYASTAGSVDEQLKAVGNCARLARSSSHIQLSGLRSKQARSFVSEQYAVWKDKSGTTSHDAFLADMAIECMRKFAPNVMAVDFGEIDCAHYGSWSRYVEAISRTDELTWKLWQEIQSTEEYRNKTLMLILPDHGRELDRAGHFGFIHHSDLYTDKGADEGCRRVWMLALGPGVKAGKRIEKPVPITAAAATGLEYLGLEASAGAQRSVLKFVM